MLFIIVGGFVGAYAFLLHYNLRELRKLHRKSADFDHYSLSRTYQFKENVVVMKMLCKIAVPFFTLLIPAFVFYALFIETPQLEEYELLRMVSAAMFDWWIGLICCFSGLSYPFFDIRFRRAARKIKFFRRCRKQRETVSTISKVPNCTATTEAYFNWLDEDWR
ncbi:hypothetical protein PRIPAC_77211 [Pristionchus pacificus]|uniref:G protein-coupled receptor n=1 Tax=Pristionchus pacificus TaxID=54126 RepID=A0A2A6C3A8_PRIPA|nr:hypothetical protein PRIPAC_77211 [Pristionchus pacificus]|eukprot:PDM72722.1 G protein-coupled receptor [Pristionchus pacificus]